MLLLVYSLTLSTAFYYWLRIKTHMQASLMLVDNPIVGLIAFCVAYYVIGFRLTSLILIPVSIPVVSFLLIQLRFWRTPKRKISALPNEIVSPADGNVIYVNRIDHGDDFISIKNGKLSTLFEFTQSDLLHKPCWQIGINMTPFDVHKNCSPIQGKIMQSLHVNGKFHSLKEFLSLTENERHTYVIANDKYRVGVVQIASKRVKRIDSYVKEGDVLEKGDLIGMIRFGSQVDVFLPINTTIQVSVGEQIYAQKTVIGSIS
jgi:phosphatidylserine decarboxylase